MVIKKTELIMVSENVPVQIFGLLKAHFYGSFLLIVCRSFLNYARLYLPSMVPPVMAIYQSTAVGDANKWTVIEIMVPSQLVSTMGKCFWIITEVDFSVFFN
jgi:hypothetical protein